MFSYAGLVPASLYGFLWWSSSGLGTATLSFLELVCLYGYSLAIYIPVSLLWLIQVGSRLCNYHLCPPCALAPPALPGVF